MFIICSKGDTVAGRDGSGGGGVYMCSPDFYQCFPAEAGFAKSHLMSQIDQSRKTLLKWWGPSCSLCTMAILYGANCAPSSRHKWHMSSSSKLLSAFLPLCSWFWRQLPSLFLDVLPDLLGDGTRFGQRPSLHLSSFLSSVYAYSFLLHIKLLFFFTFFYFFTFVHSLAPQPSSCHWYLYHRHFLYPY